MSLPQPASEPRMGRIYTLVLVCHAAVITALWFFGHTFSR
jgi:hypothetical protein